VQHAGLFAQLELFHEEAVADFALRAGAPVGTARFAFERAAQMGFELFRADQIGWHGQAVELYPRPGGGRKRGRLGLRARQARDCTQRHAHQRGRGENANE